jgi:hypothetical protein
LIPIVLVTLLLILSYTFRQCQYVYPQPRQFITKSADKTINSTSQLTKLIVVSHFKEDLDWLDLFIGDKIPHVVYTRSTDSLIRHAIPINKGREPVAYLRYIVDNYSNLPSLIAFIHAHRTAWHQTGPSDIVVALRALRWNKYTFMPMTSTMTKATFQKNMPDLQSMINYQVWRDVLQKELGPPPINGINTHCCATFVVKKEAILTHSKAFYSSIIDYLLNSTHSDHFTGRSIEYSWHLMFGQPAHLHFNTCDLYVCDDKGMISVQLAEKVNN